MVFSRFEGGEGKATETQVWVQPPGMPSVGKAFLKPQCWFLGANIIASHAYQLKRKTL